MSTTASEAGSRHLVGRGFSDDALRQLDGSTSMKPGVPAIDEKNTARVDVVVVSYNSADLLRACVEPLAADPRIHVVVVDNASSDESVGSVAGLPIDLHALSVNLGFGGGCNVGWRGATAPYVLFLNPDAQMEPDGVLRLADELERTAAGAVAPRIVNDEGELEWSLRRFPLVRSIYGQALFLHRLFPKATWADEVIRDPERYEEEGPCEWASGACLLVGRELLEQIGGFDEGFFMYCEDVDLCRRIWDAGRPVVYVPNVVSSHSGGASAPRWQLFGVLARSRIRYARKHYGRLRAIAYRVGVGLSALTHLVAGKGVQRRRGHARALAVAISPAGSNRTAS
jgi:N-acetylglucosaminyl-diphospho-decaprenol L-rhamnosyltransferase